MKSVIGWIINRDNGNCNVLKKEFCSTNITTWNLFYIHMAPMANLQDANVFLAPFIDEMEVILKYGINIEEETVTVAISAIICDALAKAFIT